MTNEPSPRPWRAKQSPIGSNTWIVSGEVFVASASRPADATLIVDAVNERDRLRDALNEVCNRVSVALNCPRHATEAIELLVHDLLGIKECARSAIGEDAP